MLGCGSHSFFTLCWALGYVLFIFRLEVLGKQRQENYCKFNTNLNDSERPFQKEPWSYWLFPMGTTSGGADYISSVLECSIG